MPVIIRNVIFKTAIESEMGLNPKSLIKNIPNKNEHWKAPVKDWIYDMYDKRNEKSRKKAERKAKSKNNI